MNEKCSKCEKEAVKFVEWKKKYYCKEHFNQYFIGQVRKVFDMYKIPSDKKICVAISGGKDSVSMAYALSKFCKNLEAVHIDLGIGEYSRKSLGITEEICKNLGIKLNVIKLKEIGYTLPGLLQKKKMIPCKICGIVKRYLLNKFAYENNFEILATGQNMNDIAMHAINTIYSSYLIGLKNFKPFLPKDKEKTVALIRPLFFLSEDEIETFLRINGIPYLKEKCPYSEEAFSTKIKETLSILEKEKPGFLRKFVSSLIKLSDLVKIDIKTKSCKKCGFPSLNDVCSFCKIVK